jgi:tetratricopeptide (TPR) repeat protein
LVVGLIWLQIQQEIGPRELVAIISRLPENEQLKPIAYTSTPIVDGSDKIALQDVVLHLALPSQRETAYCLLGDYPSALAGYRQAASAGDDGWSELQVCFLEAQKGDMDAAKQVLSNAHFSVRELLDFSTGVLNQNIAIDLLPLAKHAAELNPGDPVGWKMWLNAARGYELSSNWQGALDAYLAAIKVQEKNGVKIERSSFELRAGRIYQTQFQPYDLNAALSLYNRAIDNMNFLNSNELSAAHLYRGEVYQGLQPTYKPLQALQEFSRSLELNPNSYWAMRAIASVYLWDLKDYALAENYINQAINQNPDLPNAYLTHGDIYRQMGDLKNAVLDYQAAVTRQPGWQSAIDRITAVQAELQKKQAP